MPKPRFFEHNNGIVPPVLGLDPRCKVALIFKPTHGYATCRGCSNDEPGIPYVRLDVIKGLIETMRETEELTDAEGRRLSATITALVTEYAKDQQQEFEGIVTPSPDPPLMDEESTA